MLFVQFTDVCYRIPLDGWIDVIVRLTCQRAVSTTDALRLVNDHSPLILAQGRLAGGFNASNGARPCHDRHTHRGQLQEIAAIKVLIGHGYFPFCVSLRLGNNFRVRS